MAVDATSRPITTSTSSTPTRRTPPDPTAPKISRLTRITVNADNTSRTPDAPETVLLGTIRAGALPGAGEHESTASRPTAIALDRHRARGPRRDALGRVGRRRRFGFVDTWPSARTTSSSLAGKILHIDRDGRGLPGHPFCPAETDLDAGLHEDLRQGLPQPVPLHAAARAAAWSSATSAGTSARRSTSSGAGSSYGWPCYEGDIRTPGYEELAGVPGAVRRRARRRRSPPVYDYERPTGEARSWRARSTPGRRYPAEWRNALFFGDYARAGSGPTTSIGGKAGERAHLRDRLRAGVDLELTPDGDLVYVNFGDGSRQQRPRGPDRLRQRAAAGGGSRHAHLRLLAAHRAAERGRGRSTPTATR